MGASTANTGGSYGGGERDRKEQKKVVDKVAVIKAADTAKKNEIAAGNNMYGGAVSKAINDKLVERGYGKATGGGGTMLTSEGWKMKYGQYTPGQAQDGVAMGTGNFKGALTSTSISQEMLQSQNKMKGLMVGALSLGMPGIGATAMRLDASKAIKDAATPEKAHKEYTTQFKAKMSNKKPPKKSNIITDAISGVKATLGGGDKKQELGQ
tara:strand:- start:988 stop:1617 length:630 start_codon:yes stop_codon:yes gene_type:complete